MAFPTLALPHLLLRLSHLPSSLVVPGPLPLFSRSSCQWVDISELLPTQNPLQCLLSRWGQWASWWPVEQQRDRDGTGSHKTGRCCFSFYPVLPGPHWTLWPCPLGAFLASASSTWLPWKQGLQLWSQCQGSQAQAEKRKKSSSLHPLYRAWGSCHFLQKRNQDKAFTTYPGPNPRQFNGLLSPGAEEQYFALGSNVSPTLPSECKYLKTKPCPCLTDALDGQVVCALLAWAKFGESSQFILSPAGWLWVRPLVTRGAQFPSLRLLIQAASLR